MWNFLYSSFKGRVGFKKESRVTILYIIPKLVMIHLKVTLQINIYINFPWEVKENFDMLLTPKS